MPPHDGKNRRYTAGMSRTPFVRSCFVLVLALVGAGGCSHRTAYIRSDVSVGEPDPASDESAIVSRLVLVGDAGEMGASTLSAVREWSGRIPGRTLTVFLGDNMYPEGMTAARREEAGSRLLPQIRAVTEAGATPLFIPGNHDWADGGDAGDAAIVAQAEYVTGTTGLADAFLPPDGCPGPVAVDAFEMVRVIVVDSQWWLHDGPKPGASCAHPDPADVISAFAGLLDTDRHVVVASHHPLRVYGRHAGFSDWRDHLSPPIIGSLIALSRLLPLRRQDLNSSVYRRMVSDFETALESIAAGGGLRIWASGHEHSLQVIEGQSPGLDYQLVSGSAAKTNAVNHGDDTLFAIGRPGFMVLDLMADSEVNLNVVTESSVRRFPLIRN